MHYYYLILFLLLSLLALLDAVSTEKRSKEILVFIAVGILFLTSAFKYETGIDWYVYQKMMQNTPTLNQMLSDSTAYPNVFKQLDPGYNFLVAIVKTLGGTIQTVFIIMALFTAIFLYKSLKAFAVYPLVSIVIYFGIVFFVMDMSGIRQALTLSLFFYSLKFVHSRRFLKYIITLLIAVLFHWSAVFLLPLYFIIHRHYSKRLLICFSLISMIIFFTAAAWLDSIIISIVPILDNKDMLDKVSVYTTTKTFAGGRIINNDAIIKISATVLILLLLFWKRTFFRKKYKYFDIFLNLYLIQFIIFFAFAQFTEVADRMSFYFLLPNIVLLPLFLDIFPKKSEKPFALFGIMIYAAVFARAYLFEMRSTLPYTPYQSYILYRALDLPSTGMDRLYMFQKSQETR